MIPLLVGAGIAGLAGLISGGKGIHNMSESKKTIDSAQRRDSENKASLKKQSEATDTAANDLGKLEMTIGADFKRFIDAFESIHNRPEFSDRLVGDSIPKFNFNEIHTVSVGAGAFLAAVGSSAASVVFSSAASAGTMAAVMALGTASTGTAIASLSGAAATNAALAALGGGALAAGGGGMALGSIVLGSATAGVGVLVGGVVFAIAGSSMKKKADAIYDEMLNNESEIEKAIVILKKIHRASFRLQNTLDKIYDIYNREVMRLETLVERKNDWNFYNKEEQLVVENNILVVALLNKMINTPLLKVLKKDSDGNPKETEANTEDINVNIVKAEDALCKNNLLPLNNVTRYSYTIHYSRIQDDIDQGSGNSWYAWLSDTLSNDTPGHDIGSARWFINADDNDSTRALGVPFSPKKWRSTVPYTSVSDIIRLTIGKEANGALWNEKDSGSDWIIENPIGETETEVWIHEGNKNVYYIKPSGFFGFF